MKNPHLRQLVSAILLYVAAIFLATGLGVVMFKHQDSNAESFFKQPDKQQHMAGSTVLGLFARYQTNDPWKAWALAMAPGVAKELYDARKGGTGFSLADLAADGIGAYLGVKVGGLIFTRHSINYTRSF